MTYYTYNPKTKSLTPAEHFIRTETSFIANPSASQYATLHVPPAYPADPNDAQPTPPEGKIAVPDGYELRDGKWRKTWRYEDAPPAPQVIHTYRRSYIAQWLRGKGRWDEFKDLLEQSDDLSFMWEVSTEFDSDHPLWSQAIAAVKAAMQFSDDDIESMLSYGETGVQP